MVQIIGLFSDSSRFRFRRNWTNQDKAELYRVEAALCRAGLPVDTEQGTTEEGDPWFVFCHSRTGDVIAHFARINGDYLIAAPSLPELLTGPDLATIVRRFVVENPVTMPLPEKAEKGNVVLHPAALLTIFVATLLVMSFPKEGFAAAAEADEPDGGLDGTGPELDFDSLLFMAGSDEPFRFGEKALLLVGIVMAAEIAHFLDQENQGHGSLLQLAAFMNELSASSASAELGAGTDVLSLSLPSLWEDSGEVEHRIDVSKAEAPRADAELVVAVSSLVEADAALDILPVALANPGAPAPAEVVREQPAGMSAVLLIAEGQNALPADKPLPVEVTGSAAMDWLTSHLNSVSATIAAFSADSAEGARVVEIIDNGRVVALSDPSSEGVSMASEPLSSAPVLPVFDEVAKRAIDQFLASDSDIAKLELPDGSVLIFDQSDLSGELLSRYAWTFDDQTTISIIGHVDTIDDAMAMALIA